MEEAIVPKTSVKETLNPEEDQTEESTVQSKAKPNDNALLESTKTSRGKKATEVSGNRGSDDHDSSGESEHDGGDGTLRLPSYAPKKQASSSEQNNKTKQKNALTHLIPGYTAPMKLYSSSLDKFRPTGGIRDLKQRAERTDASTKDFVLEATSKHTKAMATTTGGGFLPKSYATAYSSFKHGTKRAPDTGAGKGWFGMAPTAMTEEMKTDLAVIRNRTYLDPKRFYKSADKHHRIVQMGTVVEGPSEYFSSRLTKKQRRNNLTDEIMADPSSSDYAKKKYKQMSRDKTRQAELRKQKSKRVKKFY